ncbi:DUF1614 domain-containing protein [Marinobacterium arenosum]|uniref:DUF1614 domain-containing protein n=1 Tax=Marinobacterium arenosum TaxID=2862496 RepID=UPI001C93DA2F|nr:DUF1614 domain-containing protein [Marinobacterium arenosum]MBY4677315.1 DUF1614 domain-containing protein [Marinobacterium arenosum]
MQQNLRYLLALVIFLIFFQTGVIERVIDQLALSQAEIAYGMGLATLASLVAIQLASIELPETDDEQPQEGRKVIIGINLGGAVIPLFFILYFSQGIEFALLPMLLLIAGTSAIVYPLTRVRQSGNIIYLFGAVLAAAVGGLAVGGPHYLVWAYTCAVLGTLIGGDLLHLPQLSRLSGSDKPILIGAGGVMDAIFLSGLLAMLTAEALVQLGLMIPSP